MVGTPLAAPTQSGEPGKNRWSRPLGPEDLIDAARRNLSWLAAATLAGLVVSVVVAFLLPDTYVSRAVIRVVPPRVPEAYLPQAAYERDLGERIESMAQTILSRVVLRNIIETYGLYPRERRRMPMEDVTELMRRNIDISQPRVVRGRRGDSLTAFEISFAYENRHLAQKVTEELASRFISMSTRERTAESIMTAQFLRDQWEAAKRNLQEIEQKLTDFRVKHAGQLPDQWNANVQRLSAMEARIAGLNGEISRLTQQKMVLESRIRVLRDRIEDIKQRASQPGGVEDPELALLEKRVEAAENGLASLLQVYTPNHPDVVRAQALLQNLRKQLEERRSRRAEMTETEAANLPPSAQAEIEKIQMQIKELELQIQAADLQIEANQKEVQRLDTGIRAIQKQLESMPVGEQEYAALLRDYELAKQRYDELNRKVSQSEMITDLESRKQGEKLELLDPATLPERPSRPIRWLIISFGVAVGLALGIALVVYRELRDASLKSLKDVRYFTPFPVLGSIPLLENDEIVQRRRRMKWLAWTAASAVSTLVMLAAIYYHYAARA